MTISRPADARRESRHNKILGERLALLRSVRGLSLAEVADAVGVSSSMLQQYETGERGVSFGRLVEIARALDEPVPSLIGETFGAGADGAGDTGAALRFARIASRLPRAKLNVLVAVARELGKS